MGIWEKPTVSSASITYVQDGNTIGTTSEIEELTIKLETQMPGDPPFVVIVTKGWSMDEPSDITELVSRFLMHVMEAEANQK